MEDIKMIIADNLTALRKSNKLTQLELAEKINYSDKAISKWERGESLPDIIMLKNLADMFGVSVDYIMSPHTIEERSNYKVKKEPINNKLIITLLSCLAIWICVTIIYVNIYLIRNQNLWMIWLWGLPASALVLLIFSAIWGNKIKIIVTCSLLVWALLGCFYIQFLKYNVWTIFLLGIPVQIAIILAGKLKKRNKESNKN